MDHFLLSTRSMFHRYDNTSKTAESMVKFNLESQRFPSGGMKLTHIFY